MIGTISKKGTLSGRISGQKSITGKLSLKVFSPPLYIGDYEVTPRLYTQSLDTDGKLMADDVTVYEIPITRTSNPQGGQTVLIG